MKKTKIEDNNLTYVCLYGTYLESFEMFSLEERGRLITAMLEYLMLGKEPEFAGNERFLWPTLRQQMDRDKESYDERCRRNRENGAKGGRPRKGEEKKQEESTEASEETEKTDGFFSKTQKPKEKEKENKKEKEKENEKEKERENEKETPPERSDGVMDAPSKRMEIPTAAEIFAFCREEDCHIDPFRFIDYYTATGWRLGNSPIVDWRPLVRRWDDSSQNVVTGGVYQQL